MRLSLFPTRSMIEQLSILGIRSFDNIKPEVIKFRGPLTLIVGCNGSGKTTIIECLKYATTGQQPPNSTGGAFIHDPNLCGEKEVMAQVKLGFKTATGTQFVVSRSMQLTVAKTSRKFKSLDASLLMVKDGERTSMSTRVGELDKIIPQHLGVSVAVLDSVIFCHQDDSLWPMSAPLILKKKFDEIFEALKWTKAVDSLKAMKKDHTAKLAVLKEREGHNKLYKDKGERVQKEASDLQDEIDELTVKHDAIEKDSKAAQAILLEKETQARKAAGVLNELNTNKTNADFLMGQIDHLKNTMEELREPDEWLSSTLTEYEERMAQFRAQKDGYGIQYSELNERLAASRKELSHKQAERGQYQAQKAAYDTQLEHRELLVKSETARYSIRGYDGDLDEDQIREIILKLRKLSQEKDRELDRVKKTNQEEYDQAKSVVTELGNLKTLAMRDKLNATQTIAKNDKKLADIQHDVDALRIDEGGIAVVEASLKNIQDRLRTTTAEFEAAGWDERLKSERRAMQDLETEDRRLRLELAQCNKLATDRAQLELVKKELKHAQSSLDTLSATYGDQLSSLVGSGWQADSLEREFHTVLDQRSLALTDATKQQTSTSSELSHVEFTLKTVRDSLKKKREEKQRCETTVLRSIVMEGGTPLSSIDDYEAELAALEAERDEIRKDIDGFKYVHDFYEKCLSIANNQNKCKLCERGFADKKQQSAAMEKLKKKLAEDGRAALSKDLQSIEADLQKAMAARLQFDSLDGLSLDISSYEKDLQGAEKKRDEILRKLSQHDSLVDQETSAKREVEGLRATVNSIVRDVSKISDHEQDISRLTSQQKLSGSSFTIEELSAQAETCAEQIQTLKIKIEKITADKELARHTLSNLENEKSAVSAKLSSAQHLLDKKHGKIAQLDEVRESNNLLRDTVQRSDRELVALDPKIKKAIAKNDEVSQRGVGKEKSIQTEKDRLSDSVNKFNHVEAEIDRYLENGGPQNLIACQRAIALIEQDQQRIETEIQEVTQKANQLKKRVDDSDRTKRNIKDNIQYRELLRDQEVLNNKIAELEKRNTTGDHGRLTEEARRAEKYYQNLIANRGPIVGEIKAKDQALQKSIEEWNTEYKDAAQNFRKAHIEVETTKAAIEDLGKYGHALDNGIMKFHSLKMEQINRIAGELWQSTYQGTDVDTIMIKSDNENANSIATRRNYNYRVVMIKQDTEMDMRGRCSAGQKVLASIIIRLALAECFGANCGIIALDEPTTNLDRDTIKSLAESLHMIIKQRKGQSNFQLIVITHDEEFLKEMKCQDFADNYFRIRRNEKQKSVIEQQNIGGLMN